MKELFDWIIRHWQFVAFVLSLLIGFVFDLIVAVIAIKNGNFKASSLINVLPDFIQEAERIGGTGMDKFTQVWLKSIDYLVSVFHCTKETVIKRYGSLISTYIENYLSTPQKKGVLYEKNNEKKT